MSTIGPTSTTLSAQIASQSAALLAAAPTGRRGQPAADAAKPPTDPQRADTVELSGQTPTSSPLPEADSLVFLRASQLPDRAAKVQALRAAIANGSYDLDAKLGASLDTISDRLLRDLTRGE